MIIGITGTDGAGKGSAVEYLTKKLGFTHISSRSTIEEEIMKRGLDATRANLRLVANDLRREFGNDVLVQKAFERISEFEIENAAIESIRTLAEAKTLKKHGGILLAVDADQKVRFERIQARQSSSDNVTFKEFVEQEKLEMDDPDPNGMQKGEVMKMADYTIFNDGEYDDLYHKLDAFIDEYHVDKA